MLIHLVVLAALLAHPAPTSGYDYGRQALDRVENAVWERPNDAILDAVAQVESTGHWWAVGTGCKYLCWGAYQQSGAYADVPTPFLLIKPIARWQAERKLTDLLTSHDHQLLPALAAYRCGGARARGDKTGRCMAYARQVLRVARAR